jgi:hypothetical protein
MAKSGRGGAHKGLKAREPARALYNPEGVYDATTRNDAPPPVHAAAAWHWPVQMKRARCLKPAAYLRLIFS